MAHRSIFRGDASAANEQARTIQQLQGDVQRILKRMPQVPQDYGQPHGWGSGGPPGSGSGSGSGSSGIAIGSGTGFVTGGATGTFSLASSGSVTATVLSGVAFPTTTYLLGKSNQGTWYVINPDLLFFGRCSSTTVGGTTATFTIYTGTQGSETTSSGVTVTAEVREGVVFSGKTYRLAQTQDGYEVANPDISCQVQNLSGADIAKGSTGMVTILRGTAGSETSDSVTLTGRARWGIFKNNAKGRAMIDNSINTVSWTVEDTDTC